jgi:ankyrin repeat protein
VKWGGDLDTVTLVTGDTPLHLAAACGHLAVVKYIISSAEDWVEILAAINNDAETPLEKAIYSEQHDVVDYLSNLQVTDTYVLSFNCLLLHNSRFQKLPTQLSKFEFIDSKIGDCNTSKHLNQLRVAVILRTIITLL